MKQSEEFMYWFAIKHKEEYKRRVKEFLEWKVIMEDDINEIIC